MQYKSLGKTGIKVSQLCFGTMSFGSRADEAQSQAMYHMCREQGINFFDCANVYQKGIAEEYLGRCIASERDKVVITTKAFSPMSDEVNDRGSSAKNLRHSLERSLKRLGTDYVDLFFIHGFDPTVAEEELLRTLQNFVQEGKVLALGVSNYAAYQVERLLWTSYLKNLVPIHCIQPMYNIAKRQAEVELLPMAQKEALGVITYSPLGGGLLSGKYKDGFGVTAGRLVENEKYKMRYNGMFYERLAKEFSVLSTRYQVAEATLAVAWVMHHQAVTAPIIGAANTQQLAPSLNAISFTPDDTLLKAIDDISPPPPVATDRSEERF
ncbi:MAG: aldo/keto reductase [Sphaerochaeta sp.]|jgi:aryl-alcohol dehydrogenase-like predicted oxidoreductase|uniref:aldo/keto reductase n=1 Tax=Sphaerochaeta sp. TaxID=1972642 RepID=UPI003D0FCE73